MRSIITVFFLVTWLMGRAQDCRKLVLKEVSQLPAACTAVTMTMLHDQQDKPYLYVANKEAGLKVYAISDINKPKMVAAIPIKNFGSLHVMHLTQQRNYLYLAIGNHFNNKQGSGMAIIDVSDPEKPVLLSWWVLSKSSGGSGIIKVEGDYAYLGAMGNGLIILDISDKTKIRLVSQFIPDINYPDPKPKKSLYNARGMQIKDGLLYLCYDAGGLRVIDIKDNSNPREIGHYSNPAMNNKPRAYNNIVVDNGLAYITADYCGLEILDIEDPAKIFPVGWWNPYGCPANNWFTSPVHANEIDFDKACGLLFLSTGKSDLSVLNVADPSHPYLCRDFGGVNNKMGTWGVSRYKDQIYLSYICAVIPFSSNWTGIRLLTYSNCK